MKHPLVFAMCNDIVMDQGMRAMTEDEFNEWFATNGVAVGESGTSYKVHDIIDAAETQLADLTPEMREFIASPTIGEDDVFYTAIPGAPFATSDEAEKYVQDTPASQLADAFLWELLLMAELPTSVAAYIRDDLGRDLSEVAAHRNVNGEEPKYAVLMGRPENYWLVVFVGNYSPRHRLGPYEEPTRENAQLDSWECLYDGEDWEGTVGQFKSAKYDAF